MPVPPQRSPRKDVKRETTGMLVNVVRSLTTSATTEQREKEKERLAVDFKKTEKLVDSLIAGNQEDLTLCLQSFCKISERITRAREMVQNIKMKLSSCKTLLHCRRDELQNLWKEGSEQNYIMRLLEDIENVRAVPILVRESIKKRHFLQACESLVLANAKLNCNCLSKLNCQCRDLQQVEGLELLKRELRRKEDEVFSLILEELNKQLYLRPSEEVLCELRRGGSARVFSANFVAEDEKAVSELSLPESSASWGSGLLNVSLEDTPTLQDNGCALEDLTHSTPDAKPVQYIAVLVESIGVLGRIAEAVEVIQRNLAKGLLKIAHHTTAFLYDHATVVDAQNPLTSGDSRYFAELLQLLFRQFNFVATLHHLLIGQLQRVTENRRIADIQLYTTAIVWKNIQAAIQNLLQEYLDVKRQQEVSDLPLSDLGSNLSVYFAKKKTTRPRRPNLFRFDATTHAQNVSAYAKEKKMHAPITLNSPIDRSENLMICMPDTMNIVIAFKPIMKFISEIESRNPESGSDGCLLRTFVEQYVNETFLPLLKFDTSKKLDVALKASDSWMHVVDNTEMKRLNRQVPLLSSTVKIVEIVTHLTSLMTTMAYCAEKLGDILLYVLQVYHTLAVEAHENLTKAIKMHILSSNDAVAVGRSGSLETEYRKISAAWAADEDICRLLKSLPNWLLMMQETFYLSCADKDGFSAVTTPFSPPVSASPLVESAEEIRARNRRESEILINGMGSQKKIQESEIIQDPAHLKAMANMHESIEWFCINTRKCLRFSPSILKRLEKSSPLHSSSASNNTGGSRLESYVGALQHYLCLLEDISSTWLLILHLEIRVQCFQKLLPLTGLDSPHVVGAFHSQEISPTVLHLNRTLVMTDDLLKLNLQQRKVRYIFEGLGHLIGAIFINMSQYIPKINDNGKKRMCRNIFSIQQCLSNITMTRETDLDRACKYYELLSSCNSPDDILNDVAASGAEYAELEYHNLLGLAIRSHPVFSTEPRALEDRLSRLRDLIRVRAKSINE